MNSTMILHAMNVGGIVILSTLGVMSLICILGLLSTIIQVMKQIQGNLSIIAGATSMIATTFDERDPTDENERLFFKHLRQSIYHAIVDGAFEAKRNS